MSKPSENPDSGAESAGFSAEKHDIAALDRRLRDIRHQGAAPSPLAERIKAPPGNALGLAFRVSVELLSALAVGAAIGWALDAWLGTRPWLMLVFVILGGVAGMLNVYRLASGFGYAAGYGPPKGQDGQSEEQTERQKDEQADERADERAGGQKTDNSDKQA